MAIQILHSQRSLSCAWSLAAALLLAAPGQFSAAAGGPPAAPSGAPDGATTGAPIADERASYSFLRTLEGSATVAAAGQGVGEELELNQPLLTGDLVRVGPRARLELALSDRNRLYLDADTGVVLERLAFSGDREERTTVLRLEGGELLLEVSEDALGDELPRIITGNSTVYIQQPGQYRVEAGVENDGQSWTRVVTRRGYAEIVTDRGSSVVREDEAMTAIGDRWTRLELAAADAPDAMERWSAALADRALAASRSARYVEPHLAYDAAALDQAGDWVEYESVRYWRPYVSSGWRPYWQGRWSWTPSGYTWVSYEPWGWVPYHYGRWCSLPGYGWAWRPGAVYSPAWVYWNWTSGWAGWVPMGYYSQFYDPWYSNGFRYGVYGWAGGGWGIYSQWNFAPVHCFRDRRFRGHMRTGRDLEHETRLPEPPRGLVTTDTRDFRPDRIDRTEDLLHEIGKRNRVDVGQELPDITDFVGRKGRLPTEVARVLVPDPKDPTDSGARYDPKGRSDRGVIRDIGDSPKIAETPGWKGQDQPKSRGIDRSDSTKEPTYGVSAPGRKGNGVSTGSGFDKPGTETSKGRLPTGTASSSGKTPITKSDPRTPETKVYGTGKAP
ncbi:MAG: FecR domain-containing protein, partial [Thermoanaerobaculia bacterium]|nr:FecR domain-containing protein [Thermoanaerobaculia bacterium]